MTNFRPTREPVGTAKASGWRAGWRTFGWGGGNVERTDPSAERPGVPKNGVAVRAHFYLNCRLRAAAMPGVKPGMGNGKEAPPVPSRSLTFKGRGCIKLGTKVRRAIRHAVSLGQSTA